MELSLQFARRSLRDIDSTSFEGRLQFVFPVVPGVLLSYDSVFGT
jgi:hypothetical protein